MKPRVNGYQTPEGTRNTGRSKTRSHGSDGQRKQTQGPAREPLIKELMERERQQRITPYYAKGDRHPSKVGYARYADDFVMMVQGKTGEAQAIKGEVGKKLQDMGLALSEEKPKLTHWRYKVHVLGYQLHGKPTRKGTSSRPILSIPRETVQKVKEALRSGKRISPHPRSGRHDSNERHVPRLVSLLPLCPSTTSHIRGPIRIHMVARCPLCRQKAQASVWPR